MTHTTFPALEDPASLPHPRAMALHSMTFTESEKNAYTPPTCLSCGEVMTPTWEETGLWPKPPESVYRFAGVWCCGNERPDRDPLEMP